MDKPTGPVWLLLFASIALMACIVVISEDADAVPYRVDLLYKDATNVKMAEGTNSIPFNFTVEHTGDVLSEDVMVKVLNVSAYWHVVLSATNRSGTYTGTGSLEFRLMITEWAKLVVEVTPDVDAVPGAYWMKVDAYPKDKPSMNESKWICVIVPAIVDFHLTVWNAPIDYEYQAIPPSFITIRLALYNLGNGPDSYLVQGDCTLEEEGWRMEWGQGVDEFGYTPKLPSDRDKQNPHFIDVNITMPAKVRAGTTASIVVNVTSTVDPSVQRPPAHATVAALQYYDFQVYIEGASRKVGEVATNVTFTLRVVNLGNGWDSFTIKPFWIPETNPGFVARTAPNTVDIDTDGEAYIDYIVQIPMNPPKKDYWFDAEVRSSNPHLSPINRSFLVTVLQVYSVSVEAPENRTTTSLGGSVEFELVVKNTGNGLDVMAVDSIEDFPNRWLVYVQPPEMTLLHNQSATCKVIVIIPSSVEDAPLRLYDFKVPVTSRSGDAASHCFLRVEILPFYRIEWMHRDIAVTNPARPVSQVGIIRPMPIIGPDLTKELLMTLSLRNFGNVLDTVSLEVTSSSSDLEVSLNVTTLEIMPRLTQEIGLSLQASDDIELGIHVVYVTAKSSDPEVATRILVLDVEVMAYLIEIPENPTIKDDETGDLTPPMTSLAPLRSLRFELPVKNAGEGPANGLMLTVVERSEVLGEIEERSWYNIPLPSIDSMETYVGGMAPWTEENPAIEWTSARDGTEGVYILSFEVYHTVGDLILARSEITIFVEEPPVVSIVSPVPDERVVGRFFVDIAVTNDDDSVEWVRAKIDGGEWYNATVDGGWSIAFEATDFVDGKHLLFVQAYDGVIISDAESVEFIIGEEKGAPGFGLQTTVLCVLLAVLASGIVVPRSRA